jgi:hypothetical protein
MHCTSCNFTTTEESEWRCHKRSLDHVAALGHVCACSKQYASKAGLKAHQKRCSAIQETNHTYDLNFYVNDANAMPEILRDIYALTQEGGDFLEKIKAYALTTPHFRLDVVQVI